MNPGQDQNRTAVAAGALCYTVWGLVPLIFQQMAAAGAGSWEIVGHRTLWSVLWAGLLVVMAGQTKQAAEVLKSPRVMAWLVLSTLLISINWGLFVWAVNNGRTLETSLGYYLVPLINMAAGAWMFHERISRFGKVAIGLAVVGVTLQAVALGHAPLISLALALTFGGYGIVRKRVKADAQTGLFVECLLMTLPGAAYVAWLEGAGQGHFGHNLTATLWLLFAGPMTVIPLALFSWAARRIPLSTMGFLQFLAPTISFVIGVAEGEAFNWLRGVSFAFIWGGAAVYAYGAWKAGRRAAETAAAIEAQAERVAAE